jgi:hypothetical protein
MRALALTLAGLVGLAAGSVLAQEKPEKGEPIGSSFYAQALVRGEGSLQVIDYWSRGSKLRIETVAGWRKYVNLVNGDTYYAYDETASGGIAIQRAAAAISDDAARSRPFGLELELLLQKGAEAVGEKEAAGGKCDLYRLTDKVGRREVCVTQNDMKLPVHSEVFLRATGMRMYTDYVNWLSGLPIPDAFFEPPESITFHRFTLQEFLLQTAREGTVSPAPIMNRDLLHGRSKSGSAASGG